MDEQKLFEQACDECDIIFTEGTTKSSYQSDVDQIEDTTSEHKIMVENYQFRIDEIQRLADKKIAKFKEGIKEIEEIEDGNVTALNQRKQILRQMEVIEYRELNPDLDII